MFTSLQHTTHIMDPLSVPFEYVKQKLNSFGSCGTSYFFPEMGAWSYYETLYKWVASPTWQFIVALSTSLLNSNKNFHWFCNFMSLMTHFMLFPLDVSSSSTALAGSHMYVFNYFFRSCSICKKHSVPPSFVQCLVECYRDSCMEGHVATIHWKLTPSQSASIEKIHHDLTDYMDWVRVSEMWNPAINHWGTWLQWLIDGYPITVLTIDSVLQMFICREVHLSLCRYNLLLLNSILRRDCGLVNGKSSKLKYPVFKNFFPRRRNLPPLHIPFSCSVRMHLQLL